VLFVPATFLDRFVVSPFRMVDNMSSILGLLMVAGFSASRLRRMRSFSGPAGLALLYLVGATSAWLAGGLVSPGGSISRNFPSFLQYFQVVVLFLIFFDTCRDSRTLKGVAIAMFVSCSVMSVLANLGLASVLVESEDFARAGVGALNLNQQAFLYALCLISFFGWCLVRWPRFSWREWVMLGCSSSMLMACVRTGSRGGLVMLIVGLGLASLFFLSPSKMPAYLTLVPLALAGVLGTVVTSEVVQARYAQTLAGNTGMRVELSQSGWQMFLQKPGVGWGAGYSEAMGDFLGRSRKIAVHNTYLQVLVSFGLIGFAPWLLLLLLIGWRLWRSRQHRMVKIGLVLFLSTLVFSLVGNNGYSKVFWMLLALLGALPELTRATMPTHSQARLETPVEKWQQTSAIPKVRGNHLTHRFRPGIRPGPPGGG
jgi:O-antigen ligase